jgi:hypothetical protein
MRALNPTTPSPGVAGLPTYCDLPSCRSTSNHVMCPLIALSTTTASMVIFRLHPKVGGSPAHPAESSSLSCGPTVRFRLLPTPPHDDAVTFSYGAVAYSGMDLHHANKSPSWAHNETATRQFLLCLFKRTFSINSQYPFKLSF